MTPGTILSILTGFFSTATVHPQHYEVRQRIRPSSAHHCRPFIEPGSSFGWRRPDKHFSLFQLLAGRHYSNCRQGFTPFLRSSGSIHYTCSPGYFSIPDFTATSNGTVNDGKKLNAYQDRMYPCSGHAEQKMLIFDFAGSQFFFGAGSCLYKSPIKRKAMDNYFQKNFG